jgi:integrase
MKLTASTIDTLVCRGKTETTFFDSDLRGFGLRCRSSGVRRWVVQYESPSGDTKRITIGSPEVLGLEEAKRIARTHLAKRALGIDVASERAEAKVAAKLTLGSVIAEYLADREGKLRPASLKHVRRYLLGWWKPLHAMPLHKVTKRDVGVHLRGPPVAAARARSRLMEFYSWAMKQGLFEGPNPVIGTIIPDEHVGPRERVLSMAELISIWRACGDDHYGKIIRLLILCGSRRTEVGGMRWDELDRERGVWIIPGERTKNGKAHTLPLPEEAWSILATVPRWRDGDFVFGRTAGFQAWSPHKRRLDQRSGVKDWRLHDLRRSTASHSGEVIGTAPHIVAEILGHARPGVTGSVYNKADYRRQVAVALQAWASHLMALIEGEQRKIVPLRP